MTSQNTNIKLICDEYLNAGNNEELNLKILNKLLT
jgi:hypothetical protein